jgi:hypothetical protein
VALALLVPACLANSQTPSLPPAALSSRIHWRSFAAGFVASVGLHEAAHIGTAVALGGRPSFGLDRGRPTVFSGIDATTQPQRQFAFSAAGLTMQSILDEVLLDTPPPRGRLQSSFERGVVAGGIGTAMFYVTLGRSGSVSDIDFMARTSSWSKDQVSLLFGGVALLHALRIAHGGRYGELFARPDPRGGFRVGLDLKGAGSRR